MKPVKVNQQSSNTIREEDDENSIFLTNRSSNTHTSKSKKHHQTNKQNVKVDSKEIADEFFHFLVKQQDGKEKEIRKEQREKTNKFQRASIFLKTIVPKDGDEDQGKRVNTQLSSNNGNKQDDLDAFQRLQQQVLEQQDDSHHKDFLFKAQINAINQDPSISEQQKRIKIQMLVNKNTQGTRVKNMMKQHQQKVFRKKPPGNETFDKKMKIFKGLDTYLETKGLMENMNETNQEQIQKAKKEKEKQKIQQALSKYEQEMKIVMDQGEKEDRHEFFFKQEIQKNLQTMSEANQRVIKFKSTNPEFEKITTQLLEILENQHEYIHQKNPLKIQSNDNDVFFEQLEKDFINGTFTKDLIQEQKYKMNQEDEWQLQMLQEQLNKFKSGENNEDDQEDKKLQKFQKKANKVMNLLVKTTKNIFKKKMKTIQEESMTVESLRERMRERRKLNLKEALLQEQLKTQEIITKSNFNKSRQSQNSHYQSQDDQSLEQISDNSENNGKQDKEEGDKSESNDVPEMVEEAQEEEDDKELMNSRRQKKANISRNIFYGSKNGQFMDNSNNSYKRNSQYLSVDDLQGINKFKPLNNINIKSRQSNSLQPSDRKIAEFKYDAEQSGYNSRLLQQQSSYRSQIGEEYQIEDVPTLQKKSKVELKKLGVFSGITKDELKQKLSQIDSSSTSYRELVKFQQARDRQRRNLTAVDLLSQSMVSKKTDKSMLKLPYLTPSGGHNKSTSQYSISIKKNTLQRPLLSLNTSLERLPNSTLKMTQKVSGKAMNKNENQKHQTALKHIVDLADQENSNLHLEKKSIFKQIDDIEQSQDKALQNLKPPKLEGIRIIEKSDHNTDMYKKNRKINLKSMKLAI